jgi:hypothetical protein
MNKLLKVSILSVFALVLLFSATSVFAVSFYQWDAPYSNSNSYNSPRCTLVSFNARPASITVGQPVTLSWSTRDCTSANIAPIGSVSLSGSKIVYPTSTTHYALTAYGPGLDDDELQVPLQKTVTVNSSVDCNNIPFSASPSTIRQGQSSTLSWDATGCTNVTISSGGYPISSNASSKGRLSVSPTKTTIYAITAFPRGSFDELPVPSYTTVTVGISGAVDDAYSNEAGSDSQKPRVSITANPSTISPGQSSVISWSTTNGNSCILQTPWSIYSPGCTGSTVVTPSESDTTLEFILTADRLYQDSTTLTIKRGNIFGSTSTSSNYRAQSNTTTEQYRSWKNYSIPTIFRNFSSWRSYSR